MEKINALIIKIALVGPEASGKTALAKQLALHYKEPWVAEYARHYLESRDGHYQQRDLDEIAKQQLNQESIAESEAKSILFCDTNPLVVKVWSNYKYGNCSKIIEQLVQESNYALHLLLKPDLIYEADPLRENPNIDDRNELFKLYQQELIQSKVNFEIVEGQGELRLKNALKILQNNFY